MYTEKTKKLIGLKSAEETSPEPFQEAKQYDEGYYLWLKEALSSELKYRGAGSFHYNTSDSGSVAVQLGLNSLNSQAMSCMWEIQYITENSINENSISWFKKEIERLARSYKGWLNEFDIIKPNEFYVQIYFSTPIVGDPNKKSTWDKSLEVFIDTFNQLSEDVYQIFDEDLGVASVLKWMEF